jgi:hypothetical protein
MYHKKTAVVLFLCTLLAAVSARTALYHGKVYSLEAVFADEVYQGDPVFLQMDFILHQKNEGIDAQASMTIIDHDNGKSIGKTNLYTLKASDSAITLFAGWPLSTYVKEGKFLIRIEYRINNEELMTFDLPFTVLPKEFIRETLVLDDSNTAIKTDVSEQRMSQIRILNALLAQKNLNSLFADSTFVLPSSLTRRTSFFGDRRIYEYTDGKSETSLHNGIDFGIPENTPVFACGAGRVVMTEYRISTGWTVVIEHLPGLYSLYYHLNKLAVETGTMVKAGDTIALSGNTGLSTGPHLHWEMRLLGQAVNPDFFIDAFGIFLAD